MLAVDGSLTRRELPYEFLARGMLYHGQKVNTGHWQALKDVPNTRTVELQNVVIEMPISPTPGSWAAYCRPNLPWAEDHFQERVAGEPTNPGKEFTKWPWYKPEWEAQDAKREFSHTYMERFWPRFGADDQTPPAPELRGVRYRYGDLNDVIELLRKEPHTRQAYLPMFFPEDTGATSDQRLPCSLGWHFMLRDERLHCFYPMRSVDLVRYLRDDAYMAGRLVQWVIDQLRERQQEPMEHEADYEDPWWGMVKPGNLTMFMSSLHVFEDELPTLRKKHASNS